MSGLDVFLSYARQDRGTARMFAEALSDEGFSVWWDASLHSGETFDEVIEQKLRDSKAVVVLWSPRSVSSRWVRAEATLADRRKKLVPAMIEPCDRPVIFELTHTADLTEWTGDITDIHWRTFMDDLRRLVREGSELEIAPAARPAARVKPAGPGNVENRAPAVARQPLRPGSDEVIFARQGQREREAPRLHASPTEERPRETDADAEMHCLEIEDDELAGGPFVIESSNLKVGRTAPADIVIAHRSVSREHCIIGLANDELLVTDLNSTNGTFIDDARISRATVLPVGSVLRLGQLSLRHAVRNRGEAQRLRHSGSGGGTRPGRIAATS